MRSLLIICLALFFIESNYQTVSAQQDTTKVLQIELKGGSLLKGKIISETNDSLKIKIISNAVIVIPKNQIVSMNQIPVKTIEGEKLYKDPNRSRLFFAPTGRALKSGRGYFSVYEIFIPFAAVGISDYFSISGGVSLIPGIDKQFVYLAPKITPYQNNNFSISGGLLYVVTPNEQSGIGVVYGVTSYEYKEESDITLGLGYGFSGGSFSNSPVIVVGWAAKVSKSLKLLSENWIFPGNKTQFLSFGLRFFGKHLSADFGFIYPLGSNTEGFPFIPWLGFAYNF